MASTVYINFVLFLLSLSQFPEELVTYGGNGQVLSNWAQFWILMNYLSTMTDKQTLVMYSGHPMGLFPSHNDGPRLVITNGMVRETEGEIIIILSESACMHFHLCYA